MADWFWSHDIGWDQFGSLLWGGNRVVSISAYGEVTRRRFAAVLHTVPATPTATVVHLEPAALATRLRETGEHPSAIAATPGDPGPVLTVALDAAPAPPLRVEVGYDEEGLRALVAEQGVADLAPYPDGDVCRYAVIVGERPEPGWLLGAARARELLAELRRRRAEVVRLRTVVDRGERRLVALARPARPGRCYWYVGLDADGVAGHLERRGAYPVDLAAVRDERGVRYAAVMRRLS